MVLRTLLTKAMATLKINEKILSFPWESKVLHSFKRPGMGGLTTQIQQNQLRRKQQSTHSTRNNSSLTNNTIARFFDIQKRLDAIKKSANQNKNWWVEIYHDIDCQRIEILLEQLELRPGDASLQIRQKIIKNQIHLIAPTLNQGW